MQLRTLPVADIQADPDFNCRSNFTMQSVEELSSSIKKYGLLSPLIITEDNELIAGFRRLRALKMAHELEVTAVVTDIDLKTARILNLLENVERKQLSLLEEAKSIAATFPDTPLPVIADKLNRPKRWVKIRQKLLGMEDEILKAADSGRITEGHLVRLQQADKGARKGLLNKFLAEMEKPAATRPTRTQRKVRDMLVKLAAMEACQAALAALYWVEHGITDEQLVSRANHDK